MERSGMEWSRAEWERDFIPLFGYFMTERNKIVIPLFGKRTEWNEL